MDIHGKSINGATYLADLHISLGKFISFIEPSDIDVDLLEASLESTGLFPDNTLDMIPTKEEKLTTLLSTPKFTIDHVVSLHTDAARVKFEAKILDRLTKSREIFLEYKTFHEDDARDWGNQAAFDVRQSAGRGGQAWEQNVKTTPLT